MKHFNIVVQFLMVFTIFQCALQAQQVDAQVYGESFSVESAASKADMLKELTAKDTISMQLKGQIVEVCQSKGCWMKVNLADGEQVFVRFKDYGFFVPTDSAEKSTILNGVAFIEEMSVEDQKHYAEDKVGNRRRACQNYRSKKDLTVLRPMVCS